MNVTQHPISFHVLDTVNGTTGAGLSSVLTLVNYKLPSGSGNSSFSPSIRGTQYHAVTDSDGRVRVWKPTNSSSPSLPELFASFPVATTAGGPSTQSTWNIKVESVDDWYGERGIKCFWPEVSVSFIVDGKPGEPNWKHYHVPMLLGPWSYSTYRGS
ncbi:hypothetical protein LOZ12_000177 [Ophidiomyces ophidiicola]|uniref:uncharacterized protein n=1 Tax=Ophidiomyces ophidiicola TaxID=1387563 RepID=UPI0020C4CA62|nr:uncharacterized protein LOZ57_003039 [Ophidiomyces ophidiicola]KAI1911221.1 hypothetical protein LOZ64_004764 [Ophidiomyces ophidiicola]KAI1947888.1 hypothetical protein LOZ57_003039 [Ophidiomyces ophidiicola]KAI1956032.1 hypothetical protein LOZ62_000023 [Ophidiomyces ophidiicola]KAI1968738.1 hypothetical protein LOZ56_004846 [Ophidiomyces ophidiicola]KAI2005741.1 hypothetical protein LOZ50_003527 [Ophidiomyces ophidiicola]